MNLKFNQVEIYVKKIKKKRIQSSNSSYYKNFTF